MTPKPTAVQAAELKLVVEKIGAEVFGKTDFGFAVIYFTDKGQVVVTDAPNSISAVKWRCRMCRTAWYDRAPGLL